MNDTAKGFLNGGDVDNNGSLSNEKKFKITKIDFVEKYKVEGYSDDVKDALVFTLESAKEKPVQVFQSTLNRSGEPSKNLFYGMTYENNEFYKPSTMLALKEAVKEELGVEAYNDEKKKHKGVNSDFFMNKIVTLVKNNDKVGYQLPMVAKASLWRYLVREGLVDTYEEIDDFCTYFNISKDARSNHVDNTKQVEEVLTENDLPF